MLPIKTIKRKYLMHPPGKKKKLIVMFS